MAGRRGKMGLSNTEAESKAEGNLGSGRGRQGSFEDEASQSEQAGESIAEEGDLG